MPEFDVPIVRVETAEAYNKHLDGERGWGPKAPCPDTQAKTVKVNASSMGEAARVAEKHNPGWVAHRSIIMKDTHA